MASNETAVPLAPTFGQLPLPPNMTLEQYEDTQRKLVTIAISAAVALGVVVWDYLVLIRDEFQLYSSSSKQLWLTPATWAFVVLRYSAFLATIPSLWFTSLKADNCSIPSSLSQVGAVLVVASSGVIFAYRVITIWHGSKIIYAVIGLAYATMLACWISVATSFHLTSGPSAPFIPSNCQPDPIVSWAPISFASSVAFDVVILVLTLSKLGTNRLPGSAVGRQVYRDSLLYFLATTCANITVLTVQSLGHKYDLLKPAIIPLSTVITVTMAQRVFLNLKLLHQRRMRQAEGLSVSGSSLPVQTTFASRHFERTFSDPSDPSERGRVQSSEGYTFKPFDRYPGHELVNIKQESVVSSSQ